MGAAEAQTTRYDSLVAHTHCLGPARARGRVDARVASTLYALVELRAGIHPQAGDGGE